MAVDASILEGKITNTAYKTEAQKKEEKIKEGNNDLDKQAFLKLLVAQMKYQDPMQPTENTEYVSQLAQFSSLEAMNNVSQSVDLQRATGLIGKVVTASISDSVTGVATEKTGSVQFVSQSGNKTYLTIDGEQYELDDVSKVWDDAYATAYNLSDSWSKALANLPNAAFITSTNKDAYQTQVSAAYASYMSMDDYTRSFISDEDKEKLGALVAQYKMLGVDIDGSQAAAAAAQASSSGEEEDETAEETVNTVTATGDTSEATDDVTETVLNALLSDTDEDS
ncbi:MAG: hypothetical protein IJT96_02765 [Lachnospiraceae bacterium]|nr:hypothetical protein [Lachnospiraceae bacterium]